MAIKKKSLIGAAASEPNEVSGTNGSKLKPPAKSTEAKKLAVAKLATAKLSMAKLVALKRLS
jgi:hypothetical protein